MLPFRRLLFPVDFSPACRAIAPTVAAMARRAAGEITLLHAFSVPIAPYSDLGPPPWFDQDDLQRLESERLDTFAAEHFPGHVLTRAVERGDPATVIETWARHQGCDLIVMPTHGHGPLRRFLIGSVTAKVLHDVNAAVWTGTPQALDDHPPDRTISTVLCALSLGADAPAVARAASLVAQNYGARLLLVHGVEMQPGVDPDLEVYRRQLRSVSDLRLRALREELGLECDLIAADGPVAPCIRAQAREHGADLIVVGRGHAQGRVSRLWSHLYEIVREAPCPVLSI